MSLLFWCILILAALKDKLQHLKNEGRKKENYQKWMPCNSNIFLMWNNLEYDFTVLIIVN